MLRAWRKLEAARSSLSAITDAMRAIGRRIGDLEEAIQKFRSLLREAQEKLEAARLNENAEEIAYWTGQVRRIEDQIRELEEKIRRLRRRSSELETEQQAAADRVQEAQQAVANAEAHLGSPGDY